MKVKKSKAGIIISVIGLVMILFSCVMTTMSHRKMQADSYVHSGVLNTVGTVRSLNYAISFGKPIYKYYGLQDLLEETMEVSGDIEAIEVTDADWERILVAGDMEEIVRRSTDEDEYIIKASYIYAFVPFDAGSLVLKMNMKPVNSSTLDYILYLFKLGCINFIAIVLISLIVFGIGSKDGVSVKKLRVTGVLILVVSQLSLGIQGANFINDAFIESVEHIADTTSNMVEHSINSVIEKGIHYDEIEGLDEYLKNLSKDIPELSGISVSSDGKVSGNASVNEISINGLDDKKSIICEYDNDLIVKRRRNNFIDVMILALITVFISLETVNFTTKHMEFKDSRKPGELYLPGFRLFIFVEGIAFALDSGFFSVLSAKMFNSMDLPKSMSFLSGMPNTMYSVAVLIGLFGCSILIDKFGMRRTLMGGIIMGIVGYVLCALSFNLSMLIAARFVYGFCDGIIINSIRLYASSQKDPRMHTKLLVEYMAAINLGVSCGVVIGGLVADVTSYRFVFILGAIIGFACLFLIMFSGFPEHQKSDNNISFVSAIIELRIPQVFIYMLFVVMPLYIASLYVAYTFPIFGDEVGFSNSMVSGCLMINYILIAYLTDPISEWVMKRIKSDVCMMAYMILQTISIGIFVLTSSIWAAILALVFTSIWDCFGMVVIDSALDNVEDTTTEESTLLQMVFGKLGMVIGPVAITSRLSQGAAGATSVIVLILAVGAIVYSVTQMYFHRKKEMVNT